jgi:serine/threonine-protein kinase RIO1
MSEPTPKMVMGRKRVNEYWNAQKRLEEAKRLGRRRSQAKWHREHYDEFERLKAATDSRLKRGIPIELPKLKAWDFAKGKVPTPKGQP